MHIVMLSDFETRGGAAIAASRLANALAQTKNRLTRLVHTADGLPHAWHTQPLVNSKIDRLLYRLVPQITTRQTLRRALFALKPDVINIHNLHSANWSLDLIRVCAEFAPLVWTLHDMWSFTGRCAYSDDCRKFITGCDAFCPTPTEYPSLEPSRIAPAWQQKRRLLTDIASLVAVAPSRWLAQEAREGLWCDHQVEVIPHGLPLNVYQPVDREIARRTLGIEVSGLVVLISAQYLNSRHKGGSLLVEALRQISDQSLTLLTLGTGQITGLGDHIRVIDLGYVSDERVKVLAFSAADFFLHPAINEAFGNVVMEAIACGTPVVGFPIGGLLDMVRPGQTGWLAESVSPDSLAKAILESIVDIQNQVTLHDSCCRVAETDYSDHLQAQRYVALFDALR